MESKNNPAAEKKQIFFARTYRHLKMNPIKYLLFLLIFVLPSVIFLCLFYDELTLAMSNAAAWVIQRAGGPAAGMCSGGFLPKLGPVYYLSLPTVQPGYGLILGNLAVSLVVLWILSTGPRKGRSISVYFSIMLFIHIMTCVFFLLGRDLYPYTITDFSDLYMKQQIGIWLTFLVLIGCVLGLENGGLWHRVLTVAGVMLYSFLFGFVRYVLFLGVLHCFSVLYMPLMFFALGPFFDFLYFVAIYAIATNRMIRMYDSRMKGEWVWA